jgi:NADH dehydrogenase (ubiquinone) Fe-S protein 3
LKKVIKEIRIVNDAIEIKTTPNNLRAVLYFLKNNTLCQYKQICEIACSDTPGKKRRFSIAYILSSLQYDDYITVVVQTNEVLPIPSVTPIFPGAG